MLSVWLCVERFQSSSTASMQQFVSFNQQRYVTAVVMFLFCSHYANFDFRSSVVLFPQFCDFVKNQVSTTSRIIFIKFILQTTWEKQLQNILIPSRTR